MMSRTNTCTAPGFLGASPSGGSRTIGSTGLGGGCGRWNSSFSGPGGSPERPVGSTCPKGTCTNCPRAGDAASPVMANPTTTHETRNGARLGGAGTPTRRVMMHNLLTRPLHSSGSGTWEARSAVTRARSSLLSSQFVRAPAPYYALSEKFSIPLWNRAIWGIQPFQSFHPTSCGDRWSYSHAVLRERSLRGVHGDPFSLGRQQVRLYLL